MGKKLLILFAGVPGCGKTPVANHLSWKFSLPIFNNDAIRSEVKEDTGYFDVRAYVERRDSRLRQAVGLNNVLIVDSSIDRRAADIFQNTQATHQHHIISFNLSEDFIRELYAATGYDQDLAQPLLQHQKFLDEYSHLVSLTIDDQGYKQRLELAVESLGELLNFT